MNESPVPLSPSRRGGRRPWYKWLYRGAVVLLLLAAVAAAYYGYERNVAEQQLRRALAELDRAEPGWRLDDIQAAREQIPDEQNGALCVLTAAKLLPGKWPK